MSRAAVTVIVTSYNYGRYIGGALASARDQTLKDIEVVVVDDGSSDNSLEVIGGFLGDPRFRLVRLDHVGQSRTKNVALTHIRAPFFTFLDADDVWAPDKLERQLARFRAEPQLGVVCTRRTLIDADGAPLPCHDAPPPPAGWVLNALYRQNFVCFSSAMMRAEVPARVGGFAERFGLAVDYEFLLRAARLYRFAVVDAPLVAYRMGHVNLSRRQFDRLRVALLIMHRFQRHLDAPARLEPATVTRSDAETFAHLGVIARGFSRRSALGWFGRALRADPAYGAAWRGLVATAAPGGLRRLARRLRGKSGDWEQLCLSPFNRPEPIL